MQRGAVNGVKSSAPEETLTEIISTPPPRRALPTTICLDPDLTSPDQTETPVPDYEDESCARTQRRKSFTFVNNFQNIILNIRSIEDMYSCLPEPVPDYIEDEDSNDGAVSDFPPPPALTADELSAAVSEAYDMHVSNGVLMTSDDTSHVGSHEPPQVRPKPLHNPCLESKERNALHRELLMNYKIGKDVLKKPELNKVLFERREKERKKEWQELKSSKGRTSLVIKLEERANRLKVEEDKKTKTPEDESQAPELARIHRKITQKSSGSSY